MKNILVNLNHEPLIIKRLIDEYQDKKSKKKKNMKNIFNVYKLNKSYFNSFLVLINKNISFKLSEY